MSKTDAYYAFLRSSVHKKRPELVRLEFDQTRSAYILPGGLEATVGTSHKVTILNPRFANDQQMAAFHRPSDKFTGYHVLRRPGTQECQIRYFELL